MSERDVENYFKEREESFNKLLEKDRAKRKSAGKGKGIRTTLAALAIAGGLSGTSGCQKPPTPTSQPQRATATSEYQPIVHEPTATAEKVIERIVLQDANSVTIINRELLLKGLTGIGGGELPPLTPEAGPEKGAGVLPVQLPELVRLNWGEELIQEEGQLEPVQAIQILATVAAGVGVKEGSTVNLTEAYPQFEKPLRFFTGQIVKEKGWEETLDEVIPWQATLKNETSVSVVGRYREGAEEGKIVIAFNDWVYVDPETNKLVSREKAPRISFAVIKEKELNRLLQMINPAITYQDGYIDFPAINGEKKIYRWFINTIDPDLAKEIEIKAGLEYVSTAKNPVVSYPSEKLRKLLPKNWAYSHIDGVRGIYPTDENGEINDEAVLIVSYENEDWVWEKVEAKVEKPSWVIDVSNAEARFNAEYDNGVDENGEARPKGRWEYYSTAKEEKGQYIVSVKQNEQGEYFFYNYAEEVDVILHPEVLFDATFAEIVDTMVETGAVKYIPCSREGISRLKVQMYGVEPGALIIYPKSYPLRVYYPYLKGGQANPGHPLMAIVLADVNQGKPGWETRWVQVYALDNEGKARVMDPGESKVGSGILAKAGSLIMEVRKGLVKILGREEYKDDDNFMPLDSFARDKKHGRLMVPKAQVPSK